MTESEKRKYVSDLYSGAGWKKKVERMRDDQVVAIYLKHVNDGEDPEEYDDIAFISDDQEDLPIVNILVSGPGPHANEDDFPIY